MRKMMSRFSVKLKAGGVLVCLLLGLAGCGRSTGLGIGEENVAPGEGEIASEMIALIKQMRSEGNSVGGVVECVVRNVPAGLGEPVFDKLEAELAKLNAPPPAQARAA